MKMLTKKEIEELNHKGFYTTGDFAQMFDLEKSTLFYYDRIGLFSPEVKKENGYRLYSWKQFDDITLIILLRDLGMPIDQIRSYTASRTPENFRSFLYDISEELEDELARILRIQNFVNKRIKMTEEALNAKTGVIEIVDCPESYYYVTPFEGNPYVIDEVYYTEAEHNKTLKMMNINSPYSTGEITPNSDGPSDKTIHHSFFQTRLNSKNDCPNPWKRPAGKYLTVYQNEGYWQSPKYHDMLRQTAESKRLTLGEWFYDEYLLDEFSANMLESYFIKHSILLIDEPEAPNLVSSVI